MREVKGLKTREEEIHECIEKNGIKLENYDLKKILKRIQEKRIFK